MINFQYIKGDILDTKDFFIAHCCNAQGAFGSGVAGAIAKRYPEVKTDYVDWIGRSYSLGDNNLIGGEICFSETNDGWHCFANIIGQEFFGNDGIRYINYDWIYDGFLNFSNYIGKDEPFSIPFIGCGLAGGKWNIIKSIIEDNFSDHNGTCNVWYLNSEERIRILGV